MRAALGRRPTARLHLAGLAGVRPSFGTQPAMPGQCRGNLAVVQELALRAGRRALRVRLELVGVRKRDPPARPGGRAGGVPESRMRRASAPQSSSRASAAKTPSMCCAALRFFTVYAPRQRPEMAITLVHAGARRRAARHASSARGPCAGTSPTSTTSSAASLRRSTRKARPGFAPITWGSGAPIHSLGGSFLPSPPSAGVTPHVETEPIPLGDVDATFAGHRPRTRRTRVGPSADARRGPRDGARVGTRPPVAPMRRGPRRHRRRGPFERASPSFRCGGASALASPSWRAAGGHPGR